MSRIEEAMANNKNADYGLGFDDGYTVAEAELLPVIEDLEKEIMDLKRQIYILGGKVE